MTSFSSRIPVLSRLWKTLRPNSFLPSVQSPETSVVRRLDTAGLLEALLQRGVGCRFRVTGGSMAPMLQSDDVVVIRPSDPQRMRRGDIVCFCNASGLIVLHRVVGIQRSRLDGRRVFRTKGDALSALDPPVHEGRVLGRVVEIRRRRSGRVVDLTAVQWRMAQFLLSLAHGTAASVIARKGYRSQ